MGSTSDTTSHEQDPPLPSDVIKLEERKEEDNYDESEEKEEQPEEE